jgi:hypothetical protein
MNLCCIIQAMVATGDPHLGRTSYHLRDIIHRLTFKPSYFLSQNAAIDAGEVDGVKINLQVLGIGNGLTVCSHPFSLITCSLKCNAQDSLSQWPGYIDYATSNPYHALAPESVIQNATEHWSKPGGCKELVRFPDFTTIQANHETRSKIVTIRVQTLLVPVQMNTATSTSSFPLLEPWMYVYSVQGKNNFLSLNTAIRCPRQ